MEFTNMPGPAHEHDCGTGEGSCVYLGSIAAIEGLAPAGVEVMDLYAHPSRPGGDGSLIHRTGADGEYGSIPVEVYLSHYAGDPDPSRPSQQLYAEIYRRAVEAGVL